MITRALQWALYYLVVAGVYLFMVFYIAPYRIWNQAVMHRDISKPLADWGFVLMQLVDGFRPRKRGI